MDKTELWWSLPRGRQLGWMRHTQRVDGLNVTLENLKRVMPCKLKCGAYTLACIWPEEMTFLISLWKVTLKYTFIIMVTNNYASINEISTQVLLICKFISLNWHVKVNNVWREGSKSFDRLANYIITLNSTKTNVLETSPLCWKVSYLLKHLKLAWLEV